MLTCSQCRFENPVENRFCQRCGAPLPDLNESLLDQSPWSPSDNVSEGSEPQGWANRQPELGSAQAVQPTQSLPEPSKEPSDEQDRQLVSREEDVIQRREDGGLDQTEATFSPVSQPLHSEPGERCPDDQFNADGEQLNSGTSEQVVVTPQDLAQVSREDEDMPTIVLPMQLARLDSAGATHVGRQRNHNEDYFDTYTQMSVAESPMGRIVQAQGLYILCDGMGGHSAGEVASAMAVEQLKNYFKLHWKETLPDEDCIREAIFTANQAIFEVNEMNDSAGSGRMGTTLVLMLLQGTRVAIAHVGDSRLYSYSRRQGLVQHTLDHEVGQLEVLRGVDPEIAYGRPESYQLTQALGPKDQGYIDPEIQFLEVNEDTLFLLCSDGLSDYDLLEEHAQGRILPLLSSRASLEQGVGELIDLANELSGHDNITAIAIRAKVRPDAQALRS